MLPVAIVNHRGRQEKAPYFIVHQLARPECLDEAKTKGTRSKIAPAQFQFLKKMVLDGQRIPPGLMLFRAAQYPLLPLVRSDVAESLAKLDLVGVEVSISPAMSFDVLTPDVLGPKVVGYVDWLVERAGPARAHRSSAPSSRTCAALSRSGHLPVR